MMEKLQAMWAGCSRKVSITKHCIILNSPEIVLVHTAPYRAGTRQRILEKEEIYQMMKTKVADPAITEWALLIVFVSRKDKCLKFCVDSGHLYAVAERDIYSILEWMRASTCRAKHKGSQL